MLKLLLLTLFIFTLAAPAFANASKTTKIYVWHNEQGTLVFSDSPRAGAEEVEVEPDNVIQSQTALKTEILDITPQKTVEKYDIVINTPKNNATIRDNTGSVYIEGGIKPRFKKGLKVLLELDGQPYNPPQVHSMFSLRDINRGEHKIKMLLLDDKGKVIASSSSVTFYMHRASSQ
ncbi:DUF4124 domain-containing protein [Colwellia echini]|uniref:DUF4124 domain-containing protein n=1 Tax=Colwellia echini TaxID=1982103 RepID=A0ABY3MVR8_9GAMM|nr:DUF4124 domain-containing protein [Colwellia echini]TYK65303.1 DUF4124 domain-containing protein [Colwellia echini]